MLLRFLRQEIVHIAGGAAPQLALAFRIEQVRRDTPLCEVRGDHVRLRCAPTDSHRLHLHGGSSQLLDRELRRLMAALALKDHDLEIGTPAPDPATDEEVVRPLLRAGGLIHLAHIGDEPGFQRDLSIDGIGSAAPIGDSFSHAA
ncbi:hypothetical protein [Actinoplanes sp. RD1]|uniref:hypothetical protein n=1 Tax=Actinoplanes sp. RD1 TaxID=3064538 RepID=UPI002741154B|nr:hypothetical protein [Actinoplanes sp. RD1]